MPTGKEFRNVLHFDSGQLSLDALQIIYHKWIENVLNKNAVIIENLFHHDWMTTYR